MKATKPLLLMAVFTATTAATAQLTVDIRVAENVNDSTLSIYLRPTTDFGDVFSSITFTLRWPMTAGDTLGTRMLGCPDAMPASPTAMVANPPYLQRTYTGFGSELLVDWGCEWHACEEQLLMTIPVEADFAFGPFEIDPATYSVGVNGDATGIVYTTEPCLSVGIDGAVHDRNNLLITPSPAHDEVRVSLPPGVPRSPFIDVISVDGARSRLACGSNGSCNIQALPTGTYMVHCNGRTGRFVKW